MQYITNFIQEYCTFELDLEKKDIYKAQVLGAAESAVCTACSLLALSIIKGFSIPSLLGSACVMFATHHISNVLFYLGCESETKLFEDAYLAFTITSVCLLLVGSNTLYLQINAIVLLANSLLKVYNAAGFPLFHER